MIELKTKKEEKETAYQEYLKAKVIFHKRKAENSKQELKKLKDNICQLNLKIAILRIEYFNNKIKEAEANIDEIKTFIKKVGDIETATKLSKENISNWKIR